MSRRYLDASTPVAFAHRGGAFDGIENSLEAFGRCVEMGYRYLETDVHLTLDGVVVALHDPTLDRTTDGRGHVRELTWKQVSQAKIGGTATIPSLNDLLDAFPDARFNIDAKSPDVTVPLVHLLQARGAEALDRVCLASFSDARLRRMRVLTGGRVATGMSPREVATLRGASYAARAGRLVRLRGDCAQVPATVRGRAVVDARFVETAHRLGKQVHVWTIDDAAEMTRLLDLGVDGLMTDEPEVLKQVLTDRGEWTEH